VNKTEFAGRARSAKVDLTHDLWGMESCPTTEAAKLQNGRGEGTEMRM